MFHVFVKGNLLAMSHQWVLLMYQSMMVLNIILTKGAIFNVRSDYSLQRWLQPLRLNVGFPTQPADYSVARTINNCLLHLEKITHFINLWKSQTTVLSGHHIQCSIVGTMCWLPAADGLGDILGINTLLVLNLSPGRCNRLQLAGTCTCRECTLIRSADVMSGHITHLYLLAILQLKTFITSFQIHNRLHI